MHFIRTALIASIVTAFAMSACGGDDDKEDNDPFATYQACFDEHHNEESLPVNKAIVVCCIDHPIAGVHPSCGSNDAECVAKLTGSDSVHNLMGSDVGSADIQAACMDYQTQKGM